jgi:hypothetical protein
MAAEIQRTRAAAMTTLGHMTPHGQFLIRRPNVREAAERWYKRPKKRFGAKHA